MERKIVLLTDYTGFFWSNHIGTKEHYEISAVDVNKIKQLLEEREYQVEVYTFSEIPEDKDWQGVYVLYASSDKRGGFYKEYITDVLLGLQEAGAILLPNFKYFRAHENKNFAEILRKSFKNEKLRVPEARGFGCFQELQKASKQDIMYPCVVKSANGSGSKGVCLAHNEEELLKEAERISAHTYYDYEYTLFRRFFEFGLGYKIKKIYHSLRGIKSHYKLEKDYSNKFLVQDYIPNLQGDYKVLYFGGKYYFLYRANRKNDFRASGSGKFSFPDLTEESKKVLDFARQCVEELGVPLLSMDIGLADSTCYLIEYQCICFGTYTLEFSEFFFQHNEDGTWSVIKERPDLEREIARSVSYFIDKEMS